MRFYITIVFISLAFQPAKASGLEVSVFGGEWVFPDPCVLHVLGSLNNERLSIRCTLNEDDWSRTDIVSAAFYKAEDLNIEQLQTLAWTGTIERTTVGKLSVTNWKTDVSKLSFMADPDPDYLESLRDRDRYERFICDDEVCLWISTMRVETLDHMTRENISRITRHSSAQPGAAGPR